MPVPFLFRFERCSYGLIRLAWSTLRPCRYRRHRPVLDALWRRQPHYSATAGAAGRFCHAGRYAWLSHRRHRPARHGFYRRGACRNARELAGRVHPKFGEFFVAAVYLAIGPCLAIPRTSSTAFEMLVPLLPEGVSLGTARLVFAIGFFVVAFALTLRPGVITRVLGRITGPALIALIVLVVGAAVISPLGPAAAPQAPYDAGAAVQGFLTGYQTMDLLASLAFGLSSPRPSTSWVLPMTSAWPSRFRVPV